MNWLVRIAAFGIAGGLLASCGGGGGGDSNYTPPPNTPPPNTTVYLDPVVYSSAPNASLTTAAEITSVTHGQVTVGGTALSYTATAGHMTALSLGNGAQQASFFYVAYTLDGSAPGARPVTFFFNGGPGSATVWLHLGSFGPKRLETGEPNMSGPAPFPIVDNAESMIDISDLVFVDAIGSGFSQAIAPSVNQTFWGVDVDAAVFRDFIMTYAARNNRGTSPKFIYGESYGGPRAAVLADLLEAAGVHLTGLVLQSPALNYNSNCGIIVAMVSCGGYLPSYGATGAWFNLSNPTPTAAEFPAFIAGARALGDGEYTTAVVAWLNVRAPPDPLLVTRLVNLTGLRTGWEASINMDPDYFRVYLQPGTLSGRYDARVTLPNNSSPGREIDPSDTLNSPSFQLRIGQYLANTLLYTNPSVYTVLSNAIQGWNFSHDGLTLPDTVPDLASALAQNPRLKVLAVNGYHDIVTPFHTTERDLARLGNPAIEVKNYVGGHMTYLENSSRRAMKADLADFYRRALAN
jgi:carboxypeptidase C (cathepsin A)